MGAARQNFTATSLFVAIVAAVLLAFTSPAGAATATIGRQDLSTISGTSNCDGPACYWGGQFNTGLATPGDSLAMPADGVITGWRVRGQASGGGVLRLHVIRPVAGGQYMGVIDTGAAADVTGLNLNPTSLPAMAGDTFSITTESYNIPGAIAGIGYVNSVGGSYAGMPLLNAGSTVSPLASTPNRELLYNAVAELEVPNATALSAQSGPDSGGTSVTITGFHLAIATSVKFGDTAAQIVSADNSTITVLSPPHPGGGAVDVTVTTAGGTSEAKAGTRFTYDDIVKPTLSKLSFARSKFRPANFGGPVASAKIGSKVRYTLSEAAKVTFTVSRARKPGRRVGKSFSHTGSAGRNSFTFSGRVGGRALKRGKYILRGVATDAAGNKSRTLKKSFRIVR